MKEAKKMERKPRWEDYECKPFSTIKDIAYQLEAYSTKLEKYCDQIEKERDELKIKYDDAKINEKGHKKNSVMFREELQALKDTLKDYFYKMEKGYDYNGHQKRQENIKSLIK